MPKKGKKHRTGRPKGPRPLNVSRAVLLPDHAFWRLAHPHPGVAWRSGSLPTVFRWGTD